MGAKAEQFNSEMLNLYWKYSTGLVSSKWGSPNNTRLSFSSTSSFHTPQAPCRSVVL
ncbi:unnamed protein product [Rhodiola kirilowii]